MNDRARKLVMLLEQSGTWTTAASLASSLGCSARTVKTTVAQLNESHPGIVVSSSHGYRLGDADAVEDLLSSATTRVEGVPQTAQERRTRILCQLLMRHNELSVEDLAQELCISLTTLENEIQAINADLSASDVALRTRGGQLFVAGDEAAKKRVISDLLFGETRDFFNQLELVNVYFPDIDIKELRAAIDERLKREGFFINGYSLSNLILHIAIALERCLNGFPAADSGFPVQGSISTEVDRVTEDILGGIEEKYQVSFSAADRRSLKLILSTCLVDVDSLEDARPQNSQVARLLDHIRARVSSEYAVDLSDGEFGVRFSLHLENLLARGESDVVLRNPQFDLIKNAYPYVYEIAVFIAEIIQSDTGLMVSEDEIAFIALHVGCFIEEQASRGNKLRAFVVSPRYNARSTSLAELLSDYFAQDLCIDAVVEEPDEIRNASQVDIIISTQELRGRFAAPVVKVSPFLGEVDRALIRTRIDAIRAAARRRAMERNLYAFFRSDLFFIDTPFKDEHDVIEAMGGTLVEREFAFPDFKERLYAREAISSSVYRDIALPHPIDMDGIKTAVAVSLHPDPISWMGSPVHAVFMLCVTREDRSFFREVFEFVAHVLNEPTSVQTVSRARTFEEFVEMLLRYY